MDMCYDDLFFNGIHGGVAVAAKAAQTPPEEDEKAARTKIEDVRTAKLRMGEHRPKAEFDQQLKDAAVTKERKESADFYKRTETEANDKFSSPEVKYEDTIGDQATGEAAGGIIDKARPASRKDVAAYRREEANKTGNERLIKQSTEEDKEIRQEDENTRKVKA